MQLNHHRESYYGSRNSGFTLLEILIVLVIAGLLIAIGAPSFFGWINRSSLGTARNEVHMALRQAQREAMQRRENWQFSLREQGSHLEWAIHAKAIAPAQVKTWHHLNPYVQLDPDDTTLVESQGVHYIYFKYTGDVSHIRTITFQGRHGGKARRCVVVSTLIGATRKGENHTKPKNNRYCY